jgi:hypothetical protein
MLQRNFTMTLWKIRRSSCTMKDIGIKDVSSVLTRYRASLLLRTAARLRRSYYGRSGKRILQSSTSALSLRSVLCYAQEDRKFASWLIKHLSANQISVSDLPKELPAGHDRQAELWRRIGEANLVVVLVGPDFLQDHGFELQLIEERLPANDWRFIPILAREVPRQGIPLLERCQLWPRSEKALASLEASQRDKVLKEISNEIKKTSDEIEMLIKRGPARQSLQDGASEVAREEKSAQVPVLPREQAVAAEGGSGATAGIQLALPVERRKRWRRFATWKVVALLALFFCVLCVSIGMAIWLCVPLVQQLRSARATLLRRLQPAARQVCLAQWG